MSKPMRIVCFGLVTLICWFGWRSRVLVQNIAWHIANHDNLVLHETVYTVPRQWYVGAIVETKLSSDAYLQYASPSLKRITTGTTITIANPKEDQLGVFDVDSMKRNFASDKVPTVRRFHTDFQDAICLEGTLANLPSDFSVECRGSTGTDSFFTGDPDLANQYYAIVKSARFR